MAKSGDKGRLEIKADTLVTFVDVASDRFDFEVVNFVPIKCGHPSDKPYRLSASSSDERDMWVMIPCHFPFSLSVISQ